MQEQTIFTEALARDDPADRAAFLDRVCASDQALRLRIEKLLQRHQQTGSFLESPALVATTPLDAPVLVEGPGTVIGPYKLLEQIGEGGMGVVYMAEQTKPVRRRVALKIIKPGMDTKQVITRFEAERQALAMMDHPNIARVLEAGATDSGRPYFVMELVRGIPITDYCDKTRLSIPDRLDLFVLVCQAVQHAHQKGIIHRDIKPSNVMVTLHDGVPVPKVIDFGIAKATGQSLTDKTLFTGLAQLIGTPLYMSPEQAELSGLDIDTRSDIYSLGVLLYELLTGSTPFDQETFRRAAIDEIRRIFREEEPPRPSTRLSTLDATETSVPANRGSDLRRLTHSMRGELDWIVMKSLEKDRRRRYETANDFAADVMRYLTDQPVEACPPSAWYRFTKYSRRNRVALATAGSVTLALIVGTAISTWQVVIAVRAKRETSGALATARAEADKATAINEFLVNDLLKQANPEKNAVADKVTLLEVLDRAAEKVKGRFHDKPLLEAALRSTLGETYFGLGALEKSRQHYAAALAIYLRERGPEAAETAIAMGQLSGVLIAVNRCNEAEPLVRQAVDRLRRIRGEEHVDTLDAMSKLATMYLVQGKVSEAEPLFAKILEGRRRVLGDEHSDTLISMGGLARVYQEQGTQTQLAKAESLCAKLLEIARRVQGEESPQAIHAMQLLAGTYAEQGKAKLSKVESLYVKVLEAQRRVQGEEHPATLNTMIGLAAVYQEQGKLPQAEALYVKVLEVERRNQGEDHPRTLNPMNLLAVAYGKQGKLSEAEPLFLKVLEGLRRVSGDEHPQTLTVMNNLAMLYQRQGKLSEAEPLFLKALEAKRRVLGEEHPSTLGILNNLADLYHDWGKLLEAESLYVKALEAKRRVLGEEHPGTLGTMNSLAFLYHDWGKLSEAESLYVKALKGKRRVLGEEHPGTLGTMNSLARLYLAQGRLSEAELLARECLANRRKSLLDDWSRFDSESLLGGALLGQKKYAEAEPLLLSGYEGMKAREAKMPPVAKSRRLAQAGERIVQLYEAWGQPEKAAAWKARLGLTELPDNVFAQP